MSPSLPQQLDGADRKIPSTIGVFASPVLTEMKTHFHPRIPQYKPNSCFTTKYYHIIYCCITLALLFYHPGHLETPEHQDNYWLCVKNLKWMWDASAPLGWGQTGVGSVRFHNLNLMNSCPDKHNPQCSLGPQCRAQNTLLCNLSYLYNPHCLRCGSCGQNAI